MRKSIAGWLPRNISGSKTSGFTRWVTPETVKITRMEFEKELHNDPVLVEEYLPGREFTVGIVGTGDEARVLGVVEIVPGEKFVGKVARMDQERRPLRMIPKQFQWRWLAEDALELSFELPAGAYATTVVRELAVAVATRSEE